MQKSKSYIKSFHHPAKWKGKSCNALVDKAIEGEYLLVFLFHGVGGEHDLNVDKAAHDELIAYIHKNKNNIWVSPLVEVMSYLE